MPVGRPKKDPKEALVEVPCKVPPEVAERIAELSVSTDRSRSQVARKLITRGLAAYRRDGSLDEPPELVDKLVSTFSSGAQVRHRRERLAEALAGAFGRNGEELSKADRETIRRILEQEDASKNE